MKQFFQPASSKVELSLEDEALLLSDISDSDTSIQTTINNLNRAEDTGQALEDVLVIAQSAPEELVDVNAQLMQSVREMAVVGTDTDPAAIISNTSLSTEALEEVKNHVKKIWDAIVLMLKQLWEQIKSSFMKYESFFESHKERLTVLRDQVKKLNVSKFNPDQMVPLALCIREGKVPKSADAVLDNWDVLRDSAQNILVSHLDNDTAVANITTELLKTCTSVIKRTQEPSLITRDFSKAIGKFVIDLTSMTKTSTHFLNPHSPDSNYLSVALTPNLPGGMQLSMKMRKEQVASKFTAVQRMNSYLASFVELEQHDEDGKRVVELKIPRPDMLIKILDEVINTVTIALGYLTSGQNKINSAHKQIETATNQLVSTLDTVEVPDAAKVYVQTFLRFNKHFATTTASTGNGMLKVVRQQLVATEHFTKKCLTAYLHMV